MNVLILEMGNSHIECVYSYVHFSKLQGHKVFLACNEKLLPLFPEQERLSGVLPLADKFTLKTQIAAFFSLRKFIRQHGIDTLIINTTEIKIIRNFIFFLPKKINCTGVVHNAKKLENSVTFNKILSRKIKKYFVFGDYLLRNIHPYHLFKVAAVYPIYFPLPQQNKIIKPANEFWVTIAGEADQERRDYKELLERVQRGDIDASVRFIFLGKYKLDNVVSQDLKKTEWWKSHITYFNDLVDYDTFHNYLKQTDLLLPLTKLRDDAFYTNSRISGSYNLGLGYKKPFLLTEQSKANTDLNPYSLYYDSMDQLVECINEFKSSELIKRQIQQAYDNGPFRNADDLAQSFCSFIEKKY